MDGWINIITNMKAQILKIAGVKNEREFYQKFPTEKAFMAKYGKQLAKLKKANVGDMIAGDITTPNVNQPLYYDDLTSNTEALVTGINPQEKQRREALSSQQAIASASGKSNQGGLADILGNIDPEMIASAFGKNGKKLKKAFGGADVPADALDYMNNGSMPSDYQAGNLDNIGQQAFGGIKSFTGSDLNLGKSKGSFDWKGLAGQAAGAIGPIAGAIQQYGQQSKDLAKTKMYGNVSDVVLQAQSSTPELSKRRYVRPEDSKVNGMNPLGARTNYLAAENGAEIQNTYAPDVMYTDLGYEPLNDSNVKQYQKGGKLISRDKINIDSYGNQGTAFRDIYQNPNMTQDTTYAYDSPTSMLRYNTNGGNPNAYVGGRGGFTQSQPDSLAKYKQLLSSPFNSDEPEGMRRLASGKYKYGGNLPTAEFGDYFQNSGQASMVRELGLQ